MTDKVIVTILVGNLNDKLSQKWWSSYCVQVSELASLYSVRSLFSGCESGWSQYQVAAWVIEIEADKLPTIREKLVNLSTTYRRAYAALVVGEIVQL